MNNFLANIVHPQSLMDWLLWWAALAGMLIFFSNRIKANRRIEKNANWGLLVAAGVGIILLGFVSGFVLTHSLFTPIELLGFYLLNLSILHTRKSDNRTGLHHNLWLFSASSYILSFMISFLMAESPTMVRLDYALMHGFIRWLVLFTISLVVLIVISTLRKEKINFRNTLFLRNRIGDDASSTHWYRVTIYAVGIFLLVSSLVWGLTKHALLRSIDQEFIDHTKELAGNSYAYYEMGQALIQLTRTSLPHTSESQVSEPELIQIINRFPMFSQLLVVNGGQITASYPSEGFSLNDDWLQDSCDNAARAGTLVSVLTPNQAGDDMMPVNAFIASAKDGICVVGLAAYEDTLLFSGSIQKINTLSNDWAYVDQYGAGIVYGDHEEFSSIKNYIGSPFLSRFSNVYDSNSIVPRVQWRHNIAMGQWQHYLLVVISPALLMHKLSPAFFVSLLISGFFTVSFMLIAGGRQNAYSRDITSLYEQIESLADGDAQAQPGIGKDTTRGSSYGGVNTALAKFRHQLLVNKQLLSQIEQISKAESIEIIVDHLKNDSILRTIGEIKLTIHTQLSNQTEIYITPGAMAVPSITTSSAEPDSDHFPFKYFLDNEVSGKIIHRYVIRNNHEILGTLSSMHEEETLSPLSQEYLDTIARHISYFLHQQAVSARYQKKDEDWQEVFEKFPFPAIILNSHNELLNINYLAKNIDFIKESLVSKKDQIKVFHKNPEMVHLIQQAINSTSTTTSVNFIENGNYVIHISKIASQDQDEDLKIIIWLQDISEETERFSFQANMFLSTTQRLRKELDGVRGRLQLFAASGSFNQSQTVLFREVSRLLEDVFNSLQAQSFEERFSAKRKIVLQPVSLIDVVIQAIRSLKPLADQNKVAVTFSNKIAQSDVFVKVDRMVTVEAFKYLIDNAIRYNDLGGHVTVVVTEGDGVVTVSIQDTGAGISAVDIARINSDQPLKASEEGTIQFGSGLRLAKAIVIKQGGTMSVRSILGEGSTFFITLPKQSQNENFLVNK
jgi:signal transduction histidine kinase